MQPECSASREHLDAVVREFVRTAQDLGYETTVVFESPSAGHSFERRCHRAQFIGSKGGAQCVAILVVPWDQLDFQEPQIVAERVLAHLLPVRPYESAIELLYPRVEAA